MHFLELRLPRRLRSVRLSIRSDQSHTQLSTPEINKQFLPIFHFRLPLSLAFARNSHSMAFTVTNCTFIRFVCLCARARHKRFERKRNKLFPTRNNQTSFPTVLRFWNVHAIFVVVRCAASVCVRTTFSINRT